MKRKKQLIACVMASVMAAGFLKATPPVFADELTSESQQSEECIETTEVTETYTELLTDIRDEINLSNQLMSGQNLFFGIICGLLIVKIFIDRFIKL